MRRRSPQKKLIDKADRALQDYYRSLRLKCIVCGVRANVMHHVIEKSRSANLRFDEDNLVPVCNSCHAKHHLSQDPAILATILDKKGKKWFNLLKKKKEIILRLTPDIIEQQIIKWNNKLTKGEKGL